MSIGAAVPSGTDHIGGLFESFFEYLDSINFSTKLCVASKRKHVFSTTTHCAHQVNCWNQPKVLWGIDSQTMIRIWNRKYKDKCYFRTVYSTTVCRPTQHLSTLLAIVVPTQCFALHKAIFECSYFLQSYGLKQ